MVVQTGLRRTISFLASLAVLVGIVSTCASAQYTVTNLVSNQPGQANNTDPDLINAWGVSYAPGGPFWVSDTGTGLSTLYNAQGVKQALVVTIPAVNGGMGTPTGQVYNATTSFVVTEGTKSGAALFLFATLDGTISGWSPNVDATNAIIGVKRTGAVYTGLALGTSNGSPVLFAADNVNNRVDMFDGKFTLLKSFTDTNLPQGSAPYNVHILQNNLIVTFTNSSGGGVVDLFDLTGKFIKTLISGGALHSPWGVALAPANFGPASNLLLIANEDDGKVNAYNPRTFARVGGSKLVSGGLWEIVFGGGSANNGNTNQLFTASGPDEYANGLFQVVTPR